MLSHIRRHWIRWSVGGVLLAFLAVTAVPYVYTTYVAEAAPAGLATERLQPDTDGPEAPLDGSWRAADGSEAEYRIDEILFGQEVTAVGRTGEVDGEIEISGTAVRTGRVEVDMASVATDNPRRDRQFRDNLMDVAGNPTATFALTGPVELPGSPAVGSEITVPARGELTLRGVTRPVTVDLTVGRGASELTVSGEVPVALADHGIPRPSVGGISVADRATVGFALRFEPA